MKRLILLLTALTFTFFLTNNSYAQQTGSFNRTVTVGSNTSWPISYYVPTSYNANNKYKLFVGLHGLGSNSSSMRDFLAQQISTNASSPLYNCIILAPDAAGNDIWTSPCDTSVMTKAIKDALQLYNIDPNQIYLNGISLGGRAAMRYGLLNYWRFCALELWCPAVQSVNEANNLAAFKYAYQNSPYIPISITVGSEDGYAQKLPVSVENISQSGGIVNYQLMHGLGHGAPTASELIKSLNFLNSKLSTYKLNDAGIYDIKTPFDEECSTSFSPIVVLQNKGIGTLTAVTINYQIDNGIINTYSWTGSLGRLEREEITLPTLSTTSGSHTFTAYTSAPNGNTDTYTANDQQAKSINVLVKGGNALAEGFEGATYPPFGWSQTGSEVTAFSWRKQGSLCTGAFGTSATCIYFDNFSADLGSKKYAIRTPRYDFSTAGNPVLTYDLAYQPSYGQGQYYYDSLNVLYSTNCGATWTYLQKKGGTSLGTTGTYSTSKYFTPTAASWKTQTINLPLSLIGNTKVMFAFEVVANFGNLMYLDNITLSGITGLSEKQMNSNELFSIAPNPSAGSFSIVASEGVYSVSMYDVTGHVVRRYNNVSNFPFEVDRNDLPSGIYLIELQSEELVKRTKVVLE